MTEETKQNFIKAFEEHSDAIFRYCFLRVNDRETAKDMAQTVFVKTWDYLHKGNEIESLRAFLYRVAHNLVVDHYKSKKADSLDALFENESYDPPAPEEFSAEEKIDASLAFDLLQKIPPEYREVVILRYVDGLSFEEIAKITEETENTVTVRFHRALGKVKQLFNRENKKLK